MSHSGSNPRRQTSTTQGYKVGPTVVQISQFRGDYVGQEELSVTQWFQPQAADFYNTGIQSWSNRRTNISVPGRLCWTGGDECHTVVPIPGSRLLRRRDIKVGPTV